MNSVLKDKIVSILTGIIIVTVVLVISYNTLMSSNTDMLSGFFNMTIVGGILIIAFVYIAYHFNIDLLNFFKKGGSIFNFAEGFKEGLNEGCGKGFFYSAEDNACESCNGLQPPCDDCICSDFGKETQDGCLAACKAPAPPPPPSDIPTDPVPPSPLLPTDPPCPEGCVAPRKSTDNCISVSKKGVNWRECPFTCVTPFGEGCNYDQDCTKAKCGAHYCSNIDGTLCPGVKDSQTDVKGILMENTIDEWDGGATKFSSTIKKKSEKDSNKGYNTQSEAIKPQTIQLESDPLDKIQQADFAPIQQADFAPIPQEYTIVNKNVIQKVLLNKINKWKNISKNQDINFVDIGKNFMLEVSTVRSLSMPQISVNNYKIIGQMVVEIIVKQNKGSNINSDTDKLVKLVSNVLTNNKIQNTINPNSTTTCRTTNMMNNNYNALINQLSTNNNNNVLDTTNKYSSKYKPYDSLFSLS